jgi:hypothetical protein
MVDLDTSAKRLRAKREELLAQLDAVDQALAALTSEGTTGTSTGELKPVLADEAPGAVVPTRVRPQRVLSDEHRQALTEGRRKARHSQDAAAGRAREMADPSPGLASTATALPRLVKREKT